MQPGTDWWDAVHDKIGTELQANGLGGMRPF
jgi:hypothetical protein